MRSIRRLMESFDRGGPREWLLLAGVTLALRLPIFFLPFFAKDEATYSALAVKILSGSLFYVGAVDHKPPGIALTYGFIYWLAGRYHLLFVRILLLGVVTATSALVGEVAHVLYRQPRARLAGLLYAVISATGLPGDMQAANTELLLNFPLAVAALLVARAVAEDKPGRRGAASVGAFIAAGALTGAGALFKYQAAMAGVAWALVALAAGGGIQRVVLRLVALVAGIVPIAAVLCGYYWFSGEWPAFAFWGWRYNFAYIALVTPGVLAWNAFFYTLVMSACWLPLVIALVAGSTRPPFFASAWLVAMLPALAAGGRFFPHYYLMVLPPLALLAVPGALAMLDSPRRAPLAVAGAATLLTVSVSLALAWFWYDIKPGLKSDDRAYRDIAAYVKAHSTPDERIFVWGNSPEIYYYADRVMGTRFAFCNYLTGKIWGTDAADTDMLDTDRFVVPRAWDELLADLHRAPPAFIVDAARGKLDGFGLNPASRYPALWDVIERQYRLAAIVDGTPVYAAR